MKNINIYISEKLYLNKDTNSKYYNYHPKNKGELRKLLSDLLKERGKDADLNDIDVSKITDMKSLFEPLNNRISNIDISEWDVSNVKDMDFMFSACNDFNCDLSKWDVSNVTTMCWMFQHCKKFNCDLSKWDVSNVKDMRYMFDSCNSFNGEKLSKWHIRKDAKATFMFVNCVNKPSWYK